MDLLKLSNQVCFPLYALSRKITAHYQPLLDKLDITYPQYLVMMLLWEFKELSVKEIGQQLMLDSGTLTPLLKRMEDKSLVVRTRSSQDERVVVITLTEDGKKLKRKAGDIPEKLMCSLGLNVEEMMAMRQLTTTIISKIEKAETAKIEIG
jgi:DNA-binding MarR family transcriptional regulator